jgi:lipoate---protein ligase
MHGEYKTPGGKLTVVDLDVFDGCLANVVVSGDFFLYPEEALDPIVAALEGAPVTLDEAQLAARVQQAIPAGAEMMGFSPQAIAIAIRRALG